MLFFSFGLVWIISYQKFRKHWHYVKQTENVYSEYENIKEWLNRNYGSIEVFGNLLLMLLPFLLKSKLEKENHSIKQLGNKIRKLILYQYLSILMFMLSILIIALSSV